MKSIAKVLGALLVVGALIVPTVQAGDVLFYYGNGGLNEGHSQFEAVVNGEGGAIDYNNTALPTMAGSGWTLLIISVPGWQDPGAFFTAAEKADITAWLNETESHRLVAIGEWDGFYGDGQAVLIDLINDVGGGTGIAFIPGVYDSGCFAYNCDGSVGVDPLVDGLTHVCKAATAIWDEGAGAAVAFPVESASPFIVSNGSVLPCIVGLGDSNILSDGCGHIPGDLDTAEFARRLYAITCAGDPVPTEESSWGVIKGLYR